MDTRILVEEAVENGNKFYYKNHCLLEYQGYLIDTLMPCKKPTVVVGEGLWGPIVGNINDQQLYDKVNVFCSKEKLTH